MVERLMEICTVGAYIGNLPEQVPQVKPQLLFLNSTYLFLTSNKKSINSMHYINWWPRYKVERLQNGYSEISIILDLQNSTYFTLQIS